MTLVGGMGAEGPHIVLTVLRPRLYTPRRLSLICSTWVKFLAG